MFISFQFLALLHEKCPEVPRWSWVPVGSKTNETRRPNKLATKYGGVDPWLGRDEPWPVCKECEDEKTFFCQVNIEDLPQEYKVLRY